MTEQQKIRVLLAALRKIRRTPRTSRGAISYESMRRNGDCSQASDR
jgi:hypothetical protein